MPSNIESFAIFSAARKRLRKSRRSIRSVSALAGGLAATILLAVPAAAQDTRGGNGGQGNGPGAPAGGTSSVIGAGGAGGAASENYEGAGGGGAGATGGAGGNAFNGTPGGAGGATAGASGGDGVGGGIGSRASGGGGGAHGAVLSGAPGTAVAGGNGGNGGSSSDGDGGGGGAGGYGTVTTGAGTIFFNNAITAGNGGNGGYGYFYGGSGGDGGIGLLLTGTGATVSISGAVTGGNGGTAGGFVASGCCANGGNGAGGIGLIGSNVNIVLHATVGGGLSGDGVTRALAMQLSGASTLTLGTGWSITGNIQSDTSLAITNTATDTLGSSILGGAFAKNGAGTLILTGSNTFTTAAITAGVLQIGDGGTAGTLGSGTVTVDTGTELAFNRSDNIAISNQITGAGLVRKLGAGQLTLNGASDYSGGTIVEAGTLALGNATAAGTGAIWLRDGTTLRNTATGSTVFFNNAIRIDTGETATINGNTLGGTALNSPITGGGDLFFTGLVALVGTNSYGTTTIDSNSELLAGYQTGGTLGTGNVTNYGLLTFGRTDTVTVSNVISGSGEVRKRNGGGVILTGNNDYTGITTLNLGTTIQVGDGGTTGSLGTGNVSNSGNLIFNRGDNITVANNISGSNGRLTKQGAGTLTLTGSNTYGGGTTISAGTLQVGNGGTAGTLGTGAVANDSILAFNRSDDITVTNAISGNGSLTKLGGGVLTLSGNNSYFGNTTISEGTLRLGSATAHGNGNIVLDGGTLDVGNLAFSLARLGGGNGTVATSGSGSLDVNAGESVTFGSTGNSIDSDVMLIVDPTGTLTLLGNNGLTGGITLAGRLVIGESDAAGGTGNTIFTVGSVISYADGVDNGTAIGLGSNTTQLEVLGTDVATQSGTIYEDLQSRGFEKTGTGTLILTATNNSYTGATTVSAGTLGLGNDTAAGTGTIKLADATILLNAACGCGPLTLTNGIEIALGGTATIDTDSYQTVLAGNITGGNLIFADTRGGGVTILTGANSYGDTAVGTGATLMVGDGGTTGTLGTGTVTTDGMLAFNRSDEVTLATAVGGSGLLGQFGTGKLILTANNSYSGGTLILDPDGTIQVGDGGTTGTLGTGNVVLGGGTLLFNRSDDITVADSIAGIGQITKLGAGTLTLSGDNIDSQNTGVGPYVGNISILAGTLAVGEFGLGGSQLVEIDNGATLKALKDAYAGDMAILSGGGTIDTGNFTLELFGSIDFQGELTKTGSGTLLIDDSFEEGIGAGGINVTAGTLGLGSDFAAGTGLIKLAGGTTLLNAACGCSHLGIDNEIRIALGGAVTFDGGGNDTDLNGVISGGDVHFTTSVSAPFAGSIFRLNGANSYGETRIGPNVELIVYDGTLGTGNVTFDAAASDPTTPAALVFQNATDYSFGGKIIGAGIVSIKADPGSSVTLTGSNSATENFTGAVEVLSGRLVLNGDFGDVVGNTATLLVDDSCFCGGTAPSLGGSGVFHGSVTLGNTELNPGNSPGTLVIAGNLTLGSGTILNFELGEPGKPGGTSNDLVTVGGNLTLDGTLNTIAWGAGYGPGYYRLFNYGGTLTDNELLIGSIAGGLDAQVLTNINGQVNLRLGGAQAIQYWDGADTGASAAMGGNGGAGTWNGTSTNWTGPTGYAINDSWKGQVGVFAGAAGGTVTVEGTQSFEELRFETNGYALSPANGSAHLNTTGGFSIIDVASGITADIGVIIQGGAGVDKTGAGTLILSAVNTYGGATDIAAGTLRLGINNAISNQSALNVQAGATFDLAGFQTSVGSIQGAGDITLGGGRLEIGDDNSSTLFSGTITGPDGGASTLIKNGSGTLTVDGSIALGMSGGLNSFLKVNSGTLRIAGTGSLSGDLVQSFSTIENNGTITAQLQSFGSLTNAGTGVIHGLTQNFSAFDNYGTMGALVSITGTAVNHGTGVINGDVQTFVSFTSTGVINGALSNFGTATIENQVNGELGNYQVGATVTLSGTVTGITNYLGVQGSLLDLAGFDTTVGSLHHNDVGGDIELGTATLTIGGARPSASFTGAIHGSGGLIKTGAGEQILGGLNDYTGATLISGGTLRLIDGGEIGAGLVTNNATLAFDGTLDRVFANTIQGSGGVTKTGAGMVALTGANGYAGTNAVLGGTLGFDNAQALGTGAIALDDGTRLRNLQGVSAISLTNAIQVSGTATLQGVDGASTTFNGAISGDTVRFGLSGGGATSFTLAAANSYDDTRIGGGVALTVGAGGSLGSGDTVFEANPIPASLTFANSSNYSYEGVISGAGSIVVDTATPGISVTLTGSNTASDNFTGAVTVDSGKLVLGGDFGDVVNNGASLTLNGGALGGSGTFHGDVTFGNASLNPGNSPGTLTIGGNLTLGAATILNFELGEAGTVGGVNNDLVNVGGNLTLDGTLNVIAQPTFGEGYYRLFNYGGSLTDNGLNLGALPGGYSPTLLTNIAGQVNILFSSSPQAIQYWDGSDLTGSSTAAGGNGGAGIWSAANTNWTAPTGYGVNDSWHSQVAVFGGAAGGAVTVQGSQAFQELRFTTNGYTIAGTTAADGLATTGGFSVVDVSTGVAATINAAISGTGGLTKTGTGTLSLGGANSYAGTTTVSAGQLNLLAGGSIAGSVVNQASFANAGTVTGAVQNDGTFTNSGTVTGAVQNNATLTSTGTLAGGLVNNGTATLAGTVGTGIVNNGAVTFSGAATVSGLQQAAAGTFNLAGFGVSLGTLGGSGAISLGGGALSVGTGNGNSSFAGTISGAGSLTKTGTGTLVLTGAASQTGGTTISGGTLQIGTAGTTGALSGAITNNGVLVLNRSDVVTLANVMSGTGGFVQAGTGTTTLTGANSYGGGTLVSAGRLRGDTASLQGAIRNDGTLEFAQTGAGSYAGSLSGAGLLEKTGTGTISFTGNSATFTGATNVLAGTLALNGLLSHSTITVRNGATVMGTGTSGGLVVQSGGTIAPGNSVGTFNVAGNVLFQAGSLFAAEVQASGADRIQATGTAQLNGTLQIINLGGNYGINSSFVLLHADAGVTGTFTVSGLNGFGLAYRPKIIYTANEVQLLLAPNQLSAVLGTGVPLTYNQLSAISRLDAAVVTGGYDPTPLSALYSLAPAAIPAALDQLSGEIYADATRAALEDERVVREAVVGRLADAADAGLSGNGAWGQVIGSWGSVDSDGNAAGYDVNRAGMIMGLDGGSATEDGSVRAGVMGHYTRITVPADARGSRATIDRTGGGFYAGAAMGGLRVRAGASLSLLDLKAKRQIAVPGLTATERGKAQGVMLQTFGEISYRIQAGAGSFVEPYLAGSATRVRFNRFAESSGPVALIVREQKSVLGIAELGLRGEVPLARGDAGGVRLGGNLGLRTAFGDRAANPAIALTAAASQAFNVRSAEIDRFAAAANLNLSADLSDTLSLRIGYSGMLGGGVREHGGRAALSLKF